MGKEQLKNPVVLGTVKEGETTLEPISIPHLDEAINQMEAFVNTEKDKHRKVWAECILESMRRVCWDLQGKSEKVRKMKIEKHSKYFDLYDIEPLCLLCWMGK